MAASVASLQSAMAGGQHTSGIFADMTVDGPEIGTLVAIVDRAKNLPNRKAMGKQNPYCAARLGKEAKKTETDKRGGQTPRWDQELRFTVHDSLDYHNLKISVFSEDKKTDLIGEAWVNLDNVIVPGGAKSDLWQNLTFKGKYAGELRVELTYYDSRPKPERRATLVEEDTKPRHSSSERVKRRPLPNNSNLSTSSSVTPDTISQPSAPARARHGPRELGTPQRTNSLPLDSAALPSLHMSQQQGQYYSSPAHTDAALPIPVHTEYEEKITDNRGYDDQYAQPDFLPALPPMPQRPTQSSRYAGVHSTPPVQRHIPHPNLPHAHSDPVIPHHQDYYQEHEDGGLYTAAPEILPDLDYQHHYVQQHQRSNDAWLPPHEQQYQRRSDAWPSTHEQQYTQRHFSTEPIEDPPPQPPSHSRSTSALPALSSPHSGRHGSTPPRPVSRGQQQYISNMSPLQTIEKGRYDGYSSPQPASRGLPYGDATSPQHRDSAGRSIQPQYGYGPVETHVSPMTRHSPHPLSQEVYRARSPAPSPYQQTPPTAYQAPPPEDDRYHQELNKHSITPVVKPRATSPLRRPEESTRGAWQRKNTYSIQNPVRAFESSDDSPLSRYRPQTTTHSTPRKSISPHPSPSQSPFAGGVPFGPDSFNVHNPGAPKQSSIDGGQLYDQGYNEGSKRTITGWDGREIDPSDHLPVASWAPEPEVKTPSKTYGLGRDRDFGPRSAEPSGTHLGKDTMVNMRRRGQSTDATPSSTIRARLVKKSAGSSPVTPLGEHANYNPVPDPYAQQDYSRGFTNGSPGIASGQKNNYDNYGNAYGPPSLPPKVPMGYGQDAYGPDALSREIASIDIGNAPRQRTQAPIAYVPVRSHRDRNSFY